ncbi:unnamed protein product [Penicillium nalgiovense]|uniref:Zn(2)-C6 fungal-type domain-containing protein n=1 Tax=Penicillium nalgiovense TaxID=60175 RepID=A0A9W4HZ03_PENNA|nr:unnamed protein product [Penicillium nalgiovense]CAG8066639.1 unnamed protein product [Penicillium nalgiovense]CAG8084280.1 unnamed protein product [Penicillium nalgiovense]CAG8147771.1 unnamed protein product [Penicillium nalgiovense]CAG8154370.1 unnamed protein product [Penicillium nalgiovense]
MAAFASPADRAHPQRVSCDSRIPSGADETAAASAPKPREKARRRNRVIHSCLECRRRKMKCDRENPCQNCCASLLRCIYVPTVNADAQLRQRLAEMKDAKDAIDDTLRGDQLKPPKGDPKPKRRRQPEQSGSDDSDTSADDGHLEPTPLAVQDAAYADEADDDIEDLGFKIGRMRMGARIGGYYRPKIADEILVCLQQNSRDPSTPVTTSGMTKDLWRPGPYLMVPSTDFLFSQASSGKDLTRFLPPRSAADKLMECYWDAVHPVSRVVHRPSFIQRYETLWEIIENGHQMPPSLAAIVYSILFSASVVMPEEQILELCQTSKQDLKDNLQLGTEHALGRAQLLRARKFEAIQAFTAYLLPMCLNEISRAHSVLTGMLIRLGECMGLHRGPTEFGFCPTECHTRRLVWYQICYLDLKTSSAQGPRPFIHRDGYTTRFPLDVTSLRSSTNNSLPWNDLIFSMVRFECQEMHRQNIAFRNELDQKTISLTKVISNIEKFRVEMDAKYGAYLNVASPSPMQRMASLVLKLFTGLFYVNILNRYMTGVTYQIPDRLRQIVLTKGTDVLEAAVELESATDLHKWAWYSSSWQDYHTALLLLIEVFLFPMRRESSRIWCCLDFIFADAISNLPPMNHKGVVPSIHEIVAHRDSKARYLLMMIVEHTRAYQNAKGLKTSMRSEDSMTVAPLRRNGDGSGSRTPLNYAHWELKTEMNGRYGSLPPSGVRSGHDEVQSGLFQPPTGMPIESDTGPGSEYFDTLANTASTWGTNSGGFSPWVRFGESGLDGDGRPVLHSGYGNSTDTTPNGNSSMAHHKVNGCSDDLNLQMLEIDWNLWDTIFPPQINDGNLDIPEDGFWSIGHSL